MADALDGKLVISICAGVTSAQLKSWVPESTTVVRAMPNTPCKVCQQCLSDNKGAREQGEQIVEQKEMGRDEACPAGWLRSMAARRSIVTRQGSCVARSARGEQWCSRANPGDPRRSRSFPVPVIPPPQPTSITRPIHLSGTCAPQQLRPQPHKADK